MKQVYKKKVVNFIPEEYELLFLEAKKRGCTVMTLINDIMRGWLGRLKEANMQVAK